MKNNNEKRIQGININSIVDLTLVDPRATPNDIEKVCDIAYKNQYRSVCVNPCNVPLAKGYICKNFEGTINVVAVVGFPLGANSTNIKIQEAKQAVSDGADEIEVVINIGRAKCLDYPYVRRELTAIRKLFKKITVTAIIETSYFNENEIIKLCGVCSGVGVDFVETSTGFGLGGANEETVKIMISETKGKCSVKASGNVSTRESAVNFANLGVERIGTSHII